jgi:hypothetical protein
MNKNLNQCISFLNSSKAKLIIMVIAIALFILSAAAPNATIGIGK